MIDQGSPIAQARTMQMPKRWPLVTQPSNRSTSFLKDSRLVNCYAEKGIEGYEVEKRFGLGPIAYNLGAGTGQGMFNWDISATNQNTFIISNNQVWQLGLLLGIPTISNIGAITTSQGFSVGGQGTVKFCIVPALNPYLVFGSGNGAPTYFVTRGAVNAITDVNFPTAQTVPGIVFLDGTTYVMDQSSNIFGSAGFNNPTVWDPLNKIQANVVSDLPIAIAQQLVYLVAFKSTSVHFFYDAGNTTGSPLAPLPGALLNYGCISADTLQDIDGVLIWVTNDINNVSQVGLMEKLQFKIVSTPAIDRFLNLNVQTTPYVQSYTFRSFVFKYSGHRFYVLTNVLANITMVYDIDQKLWYQWTDSSGNFYRPAAVSIDLSNNLIAQDYSTGLINYFGPDYKYPNDNGTLFPVDIYTPNFDAGVDRVKYLSQMRINADQIPGSKLWSRFSDDDYQTWNNFRFFDLGLKTPNICDEGSFYRRAYHFRHYGNTSLRIRSVDLQMDVGTL